MLKCVPIKVLFTNLTVHVTPYKNNLGLYTENVFKYSFLVSTSYFMLLFYGILVSCFMFCQLA